jgi:hypothetical protein
VLGGVVDAENRGAARERGKIGRHGDDQAAVDVGQQIAEQALAGHTDQNRQPEGRAQRAGQSERVAVLRPVLSEADARVEQDASALYAGAIGELEGEIKETREIGLNVKIGIDVFPVVHDHRGGAALGNHVGHRRIFLQSPDVIDDAHSQGRRSARNLGLIGGTRFPRDRVASPRFWHHGDAMEAAGLRRQYSDEMVSRLREFAATGAQS